MDLRKLPKLSYNFRTPYDGADQIYFIPDVATRTAMYMSEDTRRVILKDYSVVDSDTPLSISWKLYDTTYYHWTIMFVNKMVDFKEDWPLTEKQLGMYVRAKYGDANFHAIHHYESLTGIISDKEFLIERYGVDGYKSVTNYDFIFV